MARYKVFVTDTLWPDLEIEREILTEAGAEVILSTCHTPREICVEGRDCDAVIVNQNPMTRENLAILEKCKILVRLGVGVNEVDVEAATDQGIIVCNVPDYCQSETADHTMALVLVFQERCIYYAARQKMAGGIHPWRRTYRVIMEKYLPFWAAATPDAWWRKELRPLA